MIYEFSLVAKADLGEQRIESLKEITRKVVKEYEGDVFVEDDWGALSLAQPTSSGIPRGHFLYFLISGNSAFVNEIQRRMKINEDVLRYMIIKNADDANDAGEAVKGYKTPYSKTHGGSVTETDDSRDLEKDPKRFARRKSCWFTANKIQADWKDPKTFSWMINEFGKISPTRVSGVHRRHQRLATLAIKRARQIGLASYVSNRLAQ